MRTRKAVFMRDQVRDRVRLIMAEPSAWPGGRGGAETKLVVVLVALTVLTALAMVRD